MTELVAFVVGIIAVARATRLLVYDDFPPTKAFREWYVRHTSESWGNLFLCQFCLAPYLTAGDLGWYLLSDGWWRDAWWVVNIWAAAAYLAAILVAYDQPE